ncbi:MAG: hypothetical protein LC650_04565 [Actinobacteria bacterium]|nr:hypothetical protein [Actinomycetota bacterium]
MTRTEQLQKVVEQLDSIVNDIEPTEFVPALALTLERALKKIELAMEEIETVIERSE